MQPSNNKTPPRNLKRNKIKEQQKWFNDSTRCATQSENYGHTHTSMSKLLPLALTNQP